MTGEGSQIMADVEWEGEDVEMQEYGVEKGTESKSNIASKIVGWFTSAMLAVYVGLSCSTTTESLIQAIILIALFGICFVLSYLFQDPKYRVSFRLFSEYFAVGAIITPIATLFSNKELN